MDLHLDYYKLTLIDELENVIRKGSFVSYVWRTLGRRMQEWVDDGREEGDGLFDFFPVDKIFLMVSTSHDQMFIRPEWLSDHHDYLDDEGRQIPLIVTPAYSGAEQLAAYGRWLITIGFEHSSSSREKESNRYRKLAQNHLVECVLLASQALSYSLSMLSGTALTEKQKKRALHLDFSKLGKAGAAKRHAPMEKLKEWALQRYHEGEWPSANKAAYDLKKTVIEHGKTIGACLSKENAQRTIAEWIRKSV